MKKVVILNGPALSGKDVGAKEMCAVLGGDRYPCYHQQFKSKLIQLTKAIFSVKSSEWNKLYTRENKEKPTDILGGMSPREALIYISEDVIKPKFGKSYFGVAAARGLREGVNIFSDGGFIEEVRPLISAVGVSNILIIRIFRDGYSFEGDSRSYFPLDFGPLVVDVHNNGTEKEYFDKLEYEITRWLEKGVNDV